MPPDSPRDDDNGPQHALGLQHRTNQPSPMGLLQRASRFLTMAQTPSSSTNVALLNGARHFEVHGSPHFLNAYNLYVANTYGGGYDLNIMEPSVSFGALHDSYADDPEHRCGGRHRYVLKLLQDWIDDISSTKRILWLYGSAGSGKSAIAHTIADLYGQDKVAATFFFCRSDTDRNNGNRLFITLAWQLALSIPTIRSHIIQSLNRNPSLPWRSVETQFKELIAQPFQEIVHDAASQVQVPSSVVIIDGIDECADENLQRRILGVIGNATSDVQFPLRFLITSRLEAHIQRAFDQLKCPILCIDLRYKALEELVSFDAIHNSRGQSLVRRWKPPCTHLLKQLQDWVDNPNSVERICWLHGPAGSGKSAMAEAIADSNEQGKVVANFFFHRSDATRNDGTRLFPTLVWQFASSSPAYKNNLIRPLAKFGSFLSQVVEIQFEYLVFEPFEALKEVAQEQLLDSVVIIDGIDECDSLSIQQSFLEVIGNAVRTRCVPLRFLISSRSEGHIQEAIDCFQCPVLNIDLGSVKDANYDIQENLPNTVLSGPACDGEVADDVNKISGPTSLIPLVPPLTELLLNTGTFRKPHYKLKIAPVEDRQRYRYRSPYIELVPEPATILTLPANYGDYVGGLAYCFKRISEESRRSRTLSLDNKGRTYADIEKYLKEQFFRIATEQKLRKTWPGQQAIQGFAHKSSGHFIYANTIVKLIGKEGSNAETLLDWIRDLQPRTETPFGHLDELYMEILKWQPDQVFLTDVLALMVVRTSTLEEYKDLRKDDAALMNVSEEELETRLRRMRSLLRFEPYIDIHHQSFLDFLQDASRSGQYYISEEEGSRRYLKLITGSLVQFVEQVLDHPEYHGTHHFAPRFCQVIKNHPLRIELPVAQWQKVLQPLLRLGRKIFISCTGCTAVRIIRDLFLHFAFIRGISSIQSAKPIVDEAEEFEHIDDATVIDDSLQGCLFPLLAHLRSLTFQSGPIDTEIMTQMCTVLLFDCADIAVRIYTFLDAQNLVDLLVDMLDEKLFLDQSGPDVEHKAILLVLEIYARMPVLPRSLFLEESTRSDVEKWNSRGSDIEILCQSALIGKILDREYIVPVSRVWEEEGKFTFVGGNEYEMNESLSRWRTRASPSTGTVIQVMLGVAKAFRYLHSMSIVLHHSINSDDIFLDSNFCAKIRFFGSFLLYIVKTPLICLQWDSKISITREANVFTFGCLFYEMAFSIEISHRDRIPSYIPDILKRSPEPEIPDHVWKLIQLCCEEDPKRRPTMDEVVTEMEGWGLPPLPDPRKNTPPEEKTESAKPQDSSSGLKEKTLSAIMQKRK